MSHKSQGKQSRRAFLTGVAATVGAAGLVGMTPRQKPPKITRLKRLGSSPRKPTNLSDRQGFNRRWLATNLRRAFVPTTFEQLEQNVTEALSTYGRNVKISAGRHCYENFVYNDETMAVIDISALNQSGFDLEHNAYFVDAGCELWAAYRTLLNTYNRTLPAGSCYSVGAGGHITGGGYGLLSRMHGLTVDRLTGVDIVTWDAAARVAKLRYVSPRSSDPDERDLFWALSGGGGGNFGVIARYYFEDPPIAPDYATIWTITWDWDQVTRAKFGHLLKVYADLCATMPETDFSLLKLQHVSSGQLGLIFQIASPPGTTLKEHVAYAQARIARETQRFSGVGPFAALKKPFAGQPAYMNTALLSQRPAVHLTFLEALQTLNGSGPNQFFKNKSAYMRKAFPDNQVEALFHWLQVTPSKADMSQSLVQVDSYGGVVNSLTPEATPIPQRSSIMKLQYQTYWNNNSYPGQLDSRGFKEQEDVHLRWIRGMYQDVYADYGGTPNPANDPTGTVDGCYYNYCDRDLGTHLQGDVDKALWLYFKGNFKDNDRNLVSVKRRWDPENYFRHPQSIPLS